MPTPARVAVLPKQEGPLRIEQIDLPDPGPSQVLVELVASGICHTQLHQLQLNIMAMELPYGMAGLRARIPRLQPE